MLGSAAKVGLLSSRSMRLCCGNRRWVLPHVSQGFHQVLFTHDSLIPIPESVRESDTRSNDVPWIAMLEIVADSRGVFS